MGSLETTYYETESVLFSRFVFPYGPTKPLTEY